MTFQVCLSNGARLRLSEFNCVLFAVLNAEHIKKATIGKNKSILKLYKRSNLDHQKSENSLSSDVELSKVRMSTENFCV
jgi:hypothetical protein